MKITYIDTKLETNCIDNINYIEDDDEWVKLLVDGKSMAIHKKDIVERSYIISV